MIQFVLDVNWLDEQTEVNPVKLKLALADSRRFISFLERQGYTVKSEDSYRGVPLRLTMEGDGNPLADIANFDSNFINYRDCRIQPMQNRAEVYERIQAELDRTVYSRLREKTSLQSSLEKKGFSLAYTFHPGNASQILRIAGQWVDDNLARIEVVPFSRLLTRSELKGSPHLNDRYAIYVKPKEK